MWTKLSERLPDFSTELLVFSEEYINEDFNLEGITIGFLMDDLVTFIVAQWNNEYDYWESIVLYPSDKAYPTHWMYKPEIPKTKLYVKKS